MKQFQRPRRLKTQKLRRLGNDRLPFGQAVDSLYLDAGVRIATTRPDKGFAAACSLHLLKSHERNKENRVTIAN
ncbi:MAG: hypothetical protein ACPHL6_08905 [Rubripirellula sp.]